MVIFRTRVAELSEAALARFVARAASATKLRGAIHVLVTNNREMQSLNRRFRSKDMPTDVLSFPSAPTPPGDLAGDIAISAEIASRSASQLGHAPAQEIKILALHGILHLAGYDHEKDHGEMARKESQLRRLLRLPVGLTERNGAATAQKKQPLAQTTVKARAKRKTKLVGSAAQSQSMKVQLPKRPKR